MHSIDISEEAGFVTFTSVPTGSRVPCVLPGPWALES